MLTLLLARMLRCVVLLLVAGVAVTRAEPEVQAAISCQECIDEMHKLAYIIKGSAADIEVERYIHTHTWCC